MKKWKGPFRKKLDPEALRFSSSLATDKRLAEEDIKGSLAHVEMLGARRIIAPADARRIARALERIRKEIALGKAKWLDRPGTGRLVAEDIHMAIEARLTDLVGPVGGKLHTARSRNDQVALDLRLYLRRAVTDTLRTIRELQRTLLKKAEQYRTIIMPGYTHLQRAQPVLLAHHLVAYIEMLERDGSRFADCRERAALSPLGAAALGGTSFAIDREQVARRLALRGAEANSIDAVSDRDSLIEFAGASAITLMHLSRLAEELLLWSSTEWRFAEIGDAFTTGSSIMPQKRNPDIAELVRGKSGRVYGDLVALLTVMKSLPLAYNRDMQEVKEPFFDAADTLISSLHVMARMMRTVRFDARRFEAELNGDALLATELADYLVRKNVPFREAHGIVGEIALRAREKGCSLGELPLSEFTRRSRAFGKDVSKLLEARASVERKRSAGSTSPLEVARALRHWKSRLSRHVA
ncbi:MAG TPA: argininosuccinate lyase [Bacteroidota bacterium]|nr:argininosuccinate lyase [Bacteroidota bacterium]